MIMPCGESNIMVLPCGTIEACGVLTITRPIPYVLCIQYAGVRYPITYSKISCLELDLCILGMSPLDHDCF